MLMEAYYSTFVVPTTKYIYIWCNRALNAKLGGNGLEGPIYTRKVRVLNPKAIKSGIYTETRSST